MGEKLSFAPNRTAVLSLDLQTGVVSVYVKDDGFIPRVARVLDLARRAGMRVVHVKVGFRPDVPEASPRNVFLSAVKASTRHQQFFQGDSGAIHSGVDAELHTCLTDTFFPRISSVITAGEFQDALAKSA